MLAVMSCGGSSGEIQTYRDPDRLVKFDVPSDWRIYDADDLAGVTATPFVTQGVDFELPVVSRVVFDAAPEPDLDRLDEPISTAEHPVGSAVVRSISADQRDVISRYLLAELVVPYHSQPAAEELLKQDFDLGDDFEGVQLAVVYTDETTDEDAGAFFISVTDPEVTRLFQVAVGCSIECFNRHQSDIARVVDSWVVNTSE